jgi:hypothetical protein
MATRNVCACTAGVLPLVWDLGICTIHKSDASLSFFDRPYPEIRVLPSYLFSTW